MIALGLGSCASQAPPPLPPRAVDPPEIGYFTPAGPPPAVRSAVIQQRPEMLLDAIVDRLQQASLEVSEVDREAGFVVARYRGDPEPFVDCGWIITYDPGELERIPAASAAVSFDRMVESDPSKLNRQLRLDGRMVVSLTPQGTGTVVSTATTYVLTKVIDLSGPDGASRGQSHEVISFNTGESGRFAKGTQCQPNGRFERVVLDSLPATSIVAQSPPAARDEPPVALAAPAPVAQADRPRAGQAPEPSDAPPAATEPTPAAPTPPAPVPAAPIDVATLEASVDAIAGEMPCAMVDAEIGADNSVRLSGYVDSEADAAQLRRSLTEVAGVGTVETALEVQPWFCEILGVLDPYRNPDREKGLLVITPERDTWLEEGDALILDIFLPANAAYLYLGYVQSDGRVGYLEMMSVREWVQDTGAIRFDTLNQISPPFGREMIVAITSARPLFDAPLPAYQPPDEYVAMLRERLAVLQASGPDAALDASHLVIQTRASRSF
jgi:hypothetical protein